MCVAAGEINYRKFATLVMNSNKRDATSLDTSTNADCVSGTSLSTRILGLHHAGRGQKYEALKRVPFAYPRS